MRQFDEVDRNLIRSASLKVISMIQREASQQKTGGSDAGRLDPDDKTEATTKQSETEETLLLRAAAEVGGIIPNERLSATPAQPQPKFQDLCPLSTTSTYPTTQVPPSSGIICWLSVFVTTCTICPSIRNSSLTCNSLQPTIREQLVGAFVALSHSIRVPSVYLDPAFVPFLSVLPYCKINKLRRLNIWR